VFPEKFASKINQLNMRGVTKIIKNKIHKVKKPFRLLLFEFLLIISIIFISDLSDLIKYNPKRPEVK
jgi:hypothetical protein